MLSIIIQGGDQTARKNKLQELFGSGSHLIEHLAPSGPHLLTKEVHELLSRLTHTPPKPRIVWIEHADTLTPAAASALLKILEEPPAQTTFVLTLENASNLLQTILSRCQLITLPRKLRTGESLELKTLKQGMGLNPGDRLLLANSLGAKREVLIDWTQNSLADLANHLANGLTPSSRLILTSLATLLTETLEYLRANVSPMLAMQNLFLKLPKVKP